MIPRSSGAHLNPPAWIVFKEIFIRTVAADTGKQFCNCRRLSEAQYKSYTILTRGLSSAALAKEEARKLHGQRWMEMLINGEAKNITDLAAKLGLKPPYVTRVLGLNNHAPDIVEAIVNGAEPDGLSIAQIMKNIPEDWNEQRRLFGFPER